MWLFDFLKSQKVDVIKWENPNPWIIISKWEHEMNEIKNNSSLIVDPGMAAIFVRNWKIEAIEKESWKWSLETGNIPVITSIKNFMSWFESHEKAEVYFLRGVTAPLWNYREAWFKGACYAYFIQCKC